jgi:electron transfer flavoprotein alpha subunit
MAQGVMVIAEQRDGEIRKVSYEVVSEGKRLADKMGWKVTAVLLGLNIKDKSAKLGHYGADRVIVADDAKLAAYTTDAYVAAIADIVKADDPAVLIMGASVQGKDLAARLSARLGVGMAQDCTALSVDNGNLVAIRPIYAGKAYAKVGFSDRRPHMATARPNVMAMNEPDSSRSPEIVDAALSLDDGALKTRVVEVLRDASGKVDLTEADKIVSGGSGMKGPEHYNILEELAGDRRLRGGFPFRRGRRVATSFRTRWGRQARWFLPTSTLHAEFPARFSTWPAWGHPSSSSRSIRIRTPRSFRGRTTAL